jgi:hypothetical protein
MRNLAELVEWRWLMVAARRTQTSGVCTPAQQSCRAGCIHSAFIEKIHFFQLLIGMGYLVDQLFFSERVNGKAM